MRRCFLLRRPNPALARMASPPSFDLLVDLTELKEGKGEEALAAAELLGRHKGLEEQPT